MLLMSAPNFLDSPCCIIASYIFCPSYHTSYVWVVKRPPICNPQEPITHLWKWPSDSQTNVCWAPLRLCASKVDGTTLWKRARNAKGHYSFKQQDLAKDFLCVSICICVGHMLMTSRLTTLKGHISRHWGSAEGSRVEAQLTGASFFIIRHTIFLPKVQWKQVIFWFHVKHGTG